MQAVAVWLVRWRTNHWPPLLEIVSAFGGTYQGQGLLKALPLLRTESLGSFQGPIVLGESC